MELECTKLFRHNWIGLGRADRFREDGQFETLDVAGAPLILLQERGGVLRAYNNACRHRGTRLLDGVGVRRGIRCPFHSWAYGLDGRLISAPHMEETADFSRQDYGLHEFAVQIHAGFIFVCLAAEPPELAKQLGDFDRVHAPWPLASLVSTRRRKLVVNCNWKLFLDVFNEYYHLPTVHPNSISDIYNPPDRGDTVTGAFATQFGETTGTGGLLLDQQSHLLPKIPGLTGRAANGTRYTWLFPNMTFAASSDALWCYEAYPVSPDRCEVYQTICFPAQSVALTDFEQRADFYYARFDAAIAEDLMVLEKQQQGMNSPYTSRGRYSPGLEPGVAAFARWYAEQLGG